MESLWFLTKLLLEFVPLFLIGAYLGSLLGNSLTGPLVSNLLRTRSGNLIGRLGAILTGAVTPFCSCGSVPIVAGMTRAGVPLALALTFLISSPLIDIASTLLLFSLFGSKVALTYVAVAAVISLLGGVLIGWIVPESDSFQDLAITPNAQSSAVPDWGERHRLALREAWGQLRKGFPYLLAAAVIGTLIRTYMPDAWLAGLNGATVAWAIPLAVLIAVPVYAPMPILLPIAITLHGKGLDIGVVVAFLMAAAGLSIPEGALLSRFFKPKLIAAFFATVAVGIVVSGFTVSYLL